MEATSRHTVGHTGTKSAQGIAYRTILLGSIMGVLLSRFAFDAGGASGSAVSNSSIANVDHIALQQSVNPSGPDGLSRIDTVTSCEPQDAESVVLANCPDNGWNRFWGWRWDGESCSALYGCKCEGVDCEEVKTQTAWAICMGRHKPCCPLPPSTTAIATETPTQSSIATNPSVKLSGQEQVPGSATPTGTSTPMPTRACICWPQDIEGVTPPAPTPNCENPDQVLGYKHVGYGVCEAVVGCEAVGSDVPWMYDTMDGCLAAYADCVCIACEPLSTPIAIPTATQAAVCENCPEGSQYLDWSEWYPMDRGQKPGERAMNWWSNSAGMCSFGQSTYNYDGIPKGYPSQFDGECVDYFFNWACMNKEDADCNDYEKYMEIISERRAANGQSIYLDLWGVGKIDDWRTFFNPNALGDGSSCGCTDENVAAMSSSERRANKVPMSFLMPCETGENNWAYSNVVCSANFTSDGQGARGWDEEHLGKPNKEDPTALMFVRGRVIEYLHDPDEECNIALLVNEYFTTSCAQVDADCAKPILNPITGNPNHVDARCEQFDDNGTTKWRARHFTFDPTFLNLTIGVLPPMPTPATGTPAATPNPCEGCDNTWCMTMREEYYVRKVPKESPLTGGEYRNSGGFIGFRWMSVPNCAVDSCPNWYIDPIEGAATGTPGASPTSGPTRTPITIENESWQTRCRKFGLNCPTQTPEGTPGPTAEGTPDPWSTPFCAAPTQTPVVFSGADHSCGGIMPLPNAATATPARTKAPEPTTVPTEYVRVGIAFPTDSGATCVPTPTPTLTPTPSLTATPSSTSTPSPTITPSPTATSAASPTPTMTPLPNCDTVSSDRQCPTGGINCLNGGIGCGWEVSPITFDSLACELDPEYNFTVTATECDTSSYITQVKMQWKDGLGNWSTYEIMTNAGGSPVQWTITTCVGDEVPVAYRLRWWASSSSPVRGVDFADATLCCTNCD